MTDAQIAPAGRGFTVISLLFGLLLVVLGAVALAAPIVTSLATTITLGVLLFVAGAAGLIAVIRDKASKGRLWAGLWALSAVVLGLMLVFWPVSGALTITVFLAAAFIVRGVFAIALGFSVKDGLKSWWWIALGGLVTLALGVLIFVNWPLSAAIMLGTLVAIDLIFFGVAMIMGSFMAGRAA